MSGKATEFDLLQELVPELQAEGYEVYLQPSRPLLPAFLEGFRPDIIARRGDKNLVVEVIRKSPESKKRVKKIAGLFKGQDNWELRVVWATPVAPVRKIQTQTLSTIQKQIRDIKALANTGHFGPALLLAWATLEAIGRVLVSKQFQRPQTPGRLVQVLTVAR